MYDIINFKIKDIAKLSVKLKGISGTMDAKQILRSGPVVCAVGNDYLILVPVNCDALMSVTVNGKSYCYHQNGVRRSDCVVHRFIVPMSELDQAGAYTLIYQKVYDRRAYSCLKGRTVSKTYPFRPVKPDGDLHLYVMSDCHGIRREAEEACSFFDDDLDLLILNGDVSSSCSTVDEALLPLDLAYAVTKGAVPCVITRGNHDLRGRFSQHLDELMPARDGKMYYQVCLGPLWLLVLDAGEDKDDTHREYGGTAAFHVMRQEETVFLRNLSTDPAASYRDPSVRYRFVVSHVPIHFCNRDDPGDNYPFDIENELYSEWVDLLNGSIRPQLYISGHYHREELLPVDCDLNTRGLHCPTLIAGKPVHHGDRDCRGAALTLTSDSAIIQFTDKRRREFGKETIKLKGENET